MWANIYSPFTRTSHNFAIQIFVTWEIQKLICTYNIWQMAHTCFFLSKTVWKITSQKTSGNAINQIMVARISKWHFKFVPDMTARSGLFFLVKILLKCKSDGKQSAFLFKRVVFLYGQHEDYSLLQDCLVRLHVSVYKPTLNSLGLAISVTERGSLWMILIREACSLKNMRNYSSAMSLLHFQFPSQRYSAKQDIAATAVSSYFLTTICIHLSIPVL